MLELVIMGFAETLVMVSESSPAKNRNLKIGALALNVFGICLVCLASSHNNKSEVLD